MAVERLEFEVTANVSRLKAALTGELVDASVKGAEGMAEAVDKGATAAATRIQSRFGKAFDGIRTKANGAMAGLGQTFEATAKKIQSSNLISQLETVGSLGIQVGGNISRLSTIFTSLVRPVAIVATAFGPVPLVLAASAVAAVALGAALVGVPAALATMGTAAGAAGDRLAKLGLLEQEHVEFVREMRYATEAAAVAQDRLALSIGSGVQVVGDMRNAVTGARVVMGEAVDGAIALAGGIRETWEEAARAVPVIGDLAASFVDLAGAGNGNVGIFIPVNMAVKALAEYGREAAQEIRDVEAAMKALNATARKSQDAVRASNDAAREAAEVERDIAQLKKDDLAYDKYIEGEQKRIAEERKRRAKEIAAAEAEASREAAAARAVEIRLNDEVLRQRRAYAIETQRVLAANTSLADSYTDIAAGATDASIMAEAAITRLNDAWTTYTGSWQYQMDTFAQFWGSDLAQDAVATFQAVAGTASDILGSLEQIEQAQIDALTERAQKQVDRLTTIAEKQHDNSVDALRDLRDEGRISEGVYKQKIREANNLYTKRKVLADLADEDERVLANKAFRRQQNYQIGQAAIAAAVSAVALIPALAYLAWGAPVAAAGLASAAFGVQVAAIKTQQPPEFPVGTRLGQPSPDHHTIAVQEREAVLSRRAVEGIGGVEAVDALNRGAGGAPTEIVVALDRREIARAMVMAGHAAPDRRRGKRAGIRGRRGSP